MTMTLPLLFASMASVPWPNPVQPSCTPLVAKSISVAPSDRGHVLVLKDTADTLRVSEWVSAENAWSGWTRLPGQLPGTSEAWIQPPVGGINNIFALRQDSDGKRIEQWLRYPDGYLLRSSGIGEAQQVVSRPVCGRIGRDGNQALFAVFQDSSVHMRVWDSLGRRWGDWSSMEFRSRLPLSLNQVSSEGLNLFATSGTSLLQDWWNGAIWSGWVVPAEDGIGTDPVSVNLNIRDHFLFTIGGSGEVLARFWNGSYWTGWSEIRFAATHSLTAVALGNDSLLLYGIDAKGIVLRTSWSRNGGWGETSVVTTCGNSKPIEVAPTPTVQKGTRRIVAANAVEGILLVMQGKSDSLYSRLVHTRSAAGQAWKPVPDQPKIVSTPWLQAPVGGLNNLYALGETNGVRRTCQWIYGDGSFQTTNGLGESQEVVSVASGRIGSDGKQALFGVFRDSSVHMRVWDSLAWSWGGWTPLDHRTIRSLGVAQVTDDQLNLYATMPGGQVDQRWWKSTNWSPWVVPAFEPIVSGPTSVNFDLTYHVLFGIDAQGMLVEREWDGERWTGWRALPYKPMGEPAAVVRCGVLHLFFLDSLGNVLELERKLTTNWTVAGKMQGAESGSAMPISNESEQIAFVRRGNLELPHRLLPLQGNAVLIHPNGRRENLEVSADGGSARSHLKGVGFLQVGGKTIKVISLD